MNFLGGHPEFDALIRNTAAELNLRPELVIKDYWVTAVLRVLATQPELQGRIIFKGGTSLSKGWHLIDRFSEDIDILTTGPDFSSPPESGGQRERFLKKIRGLILSNTPLKIPDIHDPFYYLLDKHTYYAKIRFGWPHRAEAGTTTDTVFLEMGFRGGPNPHTKVSMNSFVGEFLLKRSVKDQESFKEWLDDITPFPMDLLDPSQTFAEKLLYLHTTVPLKIEEVRTRHLYDVVNIFRSHKRISEVITSEEFRGLLQSAIETSNRWYGTKLDVDKIDFKTSPILNLSADQAKTLAASYSREETLYFRGQRPFTELLQGLGEIRKKFVGK